MSNNPFDIFGLGADPNDPATSPARKAQVNSAKPLPAKFYETVEIVSDDGYLLQLDGRAVRTPARQLIKLPVEKVAEAMADEWRQQKAVIDPKTMPLTRLINSAIDGVSTQMEQVQDEIVRFSGTDLLCYRADSPERLVEQQNQAWNPVIEWAEKTYSCSFVLAGGIMHVEQPEETISAVRRVVSTFDDPLRLAALHSMTTLMGSSLLALATAEGFLSKQEAWSAAHIDEDWNIALWGADEEAENRLAYRYEEMGAAVLFFQ